MPRRPLREPGDPYLAAIDTENWHMRTAKSAELNARRWEVARLYLTGYNLYDIAEHFGVAVSNISRDLTAVRKVWLQAAVRDFDKARGEELAKIDALEQEYWSAWRRSQEDAQVRTTKARSGKAPEDSQTNAPTSAELEVTDRTEGQAGDPRFLAGVQWCIERRCAILGLDQPKTIGLMIGNKTLDKASDTELTLFILSEITALLQPGGSSAQSTLPGAALDDSTVIDGQARDPEGQPSEQL